MESRGHLQPGISPDLTILLASRIIQAHYLRPKTGKPLYFLPHVMPQQPLYKDPSPLSIPPIQPCQSDAVLI